MSNHVSPPAEIDQLLARISARTDALRRGTSEPGSPGTERLLVDDLARVAAILRTGATALGESLDGVIDRADASLHDVGRESGSS